MAIFTTIVDSHRDLTFGLFCGEEASEDNEFGRSSVEGSISTSGENGWSIPGVHVPVMHMIQAWLDICRYVVVFITHVVAPIGLC